MAPFQEPTEIEGVRYVGRISRKAYEEHAARPEVQALIQSARESWARNHPETVNPAGQD